MASSRLPAFPYRDNGHAYRIQSFDELYALRDEIRSERIVQNINDEIEGVGRLIHKGAQRIKDVFSQ